MGWEQKLKRVERRWRVATVAVGVEVRRWRWQRRAIDDVCSVVWD